MISRDTTTSVVFILRVISRDRRSHHPNVKFRMHLRRARFAPSRRLTSIPSTAKKKAAYGAHAPLRTLDTISPTRTRILAFQAKRKEANTHRRLVGRICTCACTAGGQEDEGGGSGYGEAKGTEGCGKKRVHAHAATHGSSSNSNSSGSSDLPLVHSRSPLFLSSISSLFLAHSSWREGWKPSASR